MTGCYFYDARVFDAEREHVFYPAWHCVAHVNELQEPGSFATLDIFDQSVVVMRGGWETPKFLYIPVYPTADLLK